MRNSRNDDPQRLRQEPDRDRSPGRSRSHFRTTTDVGGAPLGPAAQRRRPTVVRVKQSDGCIGDTVWLSPAARLRK